MLAELHARSAPADANWYSHAGRQCRDLADELGVDHDRFIGAVAAMSPRQAWDTPNGATPNLTAAARIARGESNVGLRRNEELARRILAGERPLDVLTGPKTRAFYSALAGDESAVVLDVWMARALGHPRDSFTASQYSTFADHVRTVADAIGIPPARLQAAAWAQIRREFAAERIAA